MTKESLYSLIEAKKRELSIPFKKDEGYDLCKKFCSENPIDKIEDFLNIDIWFFIKCYYYLTPKKESIHKCFDKIDSFANFFDDMSFGDINLFYNGCLSLYDNELLDIAIRYIQATDIKEEIEIENFFDLSNIYYLTFIIKIKNNAEIRNSNIINLFNMIKDNPKNVDFLGFLVAYVGMNEARNILNNPEIVKLFPNGVSIEQNLKNNFKTDLLLRDVRTIFDFVRKIEIDEEQHNKKVNSEINALDRAVSLFEDALKKPEIVNARAIIKNIKDQEIKLAFLQLINSHNDKYYQKLNAELAELNENSNAKYVAVLNDYGINVSEDAVTDIMINSVKDVSVILADLKNLNLSESNILNILKNTNVEIVLNIKEWINKSYISLEFVINNIDMFYKESEKYALYNNNLNILKKYNINPALFCESVEVMFYENLDDSLRLLDSYNLIKCLKGTDNYSFLLNDSFVIKIDKLLELGYETLLEQNLGLLNYDTKRLELMGALNMSFSTVDKVFSLLDKNNMFFVDDDKIDEYIPNVIPFMKKVDINITMEELSNYSISNRVYSFDGVLVSINKVQSLVEQGIDLYDAILANMKLDGDSYDRLIGCLCSKKYVKS